MNKPIIIACATDDGVNLTREHFGSAKFYLLYSFDLKSGEINFLKKINNISVEERVHGDPNKAKSVSKLLKDVDVLIGFVMGPNIVRMRKKFIPVISRERSINKIIKIIKNKPREIEKNMKIPPGKDKDIVYINQS